MDTGTAIFLAACAPVVNQWITAYLHHRSEKLDLKRSQALAAENGEKIDAVHDVLKKMNGNSEH